MAIDYSVESLEGIDEGLHSLYQEKEGKFYLDVNGVKPIQDFDNVQKALSNERNLKKDIEKQLKAFGERTPESYGELEQKINELQLLADSNQNNTEEVKTKIENIKTDYQAKMTAAQETAMKNALEKDNVINELKNTILEGQKKEAILEEIKSIAKTESLGDVMSLLKSMIDYNSDLEQFEEKETGLDVKSTVEKFFKDRPYFVKESTSGNVTGNTNGQISKNPWKDPNSTLTDKAKFQKEHPEIALKYRKEAGLVK